MGIGVILPVIRLLPTRRKSRKKRDELYSDGFLPFYHVSR